MVKYMTKRIEHYFGEILNARGSIFLEDVPTPLGQKGRFALIECGECHKPHIQKLCCVINNNAACYECGKKRTKKAINEKISNHYKYGDILNSDTNIIFIKEVPHKGYVKRRAIVKCPSCLRTYEAAISNVVNGSGCPYCSDAHTSKAARKVEKILQKNNVLFKTEYSFKDLVGEKNRRLRFDFAIFLESGFILLLEIDGQQHYRPVEHWGGEKSFYQLQKNDIRKNQYVNNKDNLFLERIPYTQFNDINNTFIMNIIKKYSCID